MAQPDSHSKPHITVRYPVDKLSATDLSMYESARVDNLALLAPGTFNPFPSQRGDKVSTVFVQCRSEVMEALSYKPDYPDSVFHLTVYDGLSSAFAADVLHAMLQYDWHFLARFPPIALSRIPVGASKNRSTGVGSMLDTNALELLRKLVGHDATPDTIAELEHTQRIKVVDDICALLNERPARLPKTGKSLLHSGQSRNLGLQPDLWGEVDIRGAGRRSPLLSAEARRELRNGHHSVGLFLTPPELAQELVITAVAEHAGRVKIDFGDPAIGSGIFFATLLRHVDQTRIRSAVGVELDVLRAELTAEKWAARNLEVVTGAFPDIRLDSGSRSLIIANPPYVRSQKLDRDVTRRWQIELAGELDIQVSGRADLYVYILLSCHRWMAPGAVAAWLLPTEFMQTDYGRAVREYLTTYVQLRRIHTFDSTKPLFENARVSSTAVFFQNRPPEANDAVIVSSGGTIASPVEQRELHIKDIHGLHKWAPAAWDSRPTRPSPDYSYRLGDLFQIKRGIATGANHFFVKSLREVKMLDIPRRWRRPLIPRMRLLDDSVIEANNDGDPLLDSVEWLIDCVESMVLIEEVAPAFAMYLRSASEEILSRRLLRDRRPFYRQESRQPPPFLFSYMSRDVSNRDVGPFLLNRSSAVYLNNYHGLYPRFNLQDSAQRGVTDVDILRMLQKIDRTEFAREGRSYVSGLRKMEPRELAEVRVICSVEISEVLSLERR